MWLYGMCFIMVPFTFLDNFILSGPPRRDAKFASLHRTPSAVSAVWSSPLIVTILRHIREEQPRERELPRGAVAEHQLLRDVQIDTVVVLVGVIVQRTVRHVEKVIRGQTEGVRGGGSNAPAR